MLSTQRCNSWWIKSFNITRPKYVDIVISVYSSVYVWLILPIKYEMNKGASKNNVNISFTRRVPFNHDGKSATRIHYNSISFIYQRLSCDKHESALNISAISTQQLLSTSRSQLYTIQVYIDNWKEICMSHYVQISSQQYSVQSVFFVCGKWRDIITLQF